MKEIIIILILSPFILVAQQYTEVVELPGTTADQLYSTTQDLLSISFNEAHHIIQCDPAEKAILGKGITQIECLISNTPVTMNVYFTVNTHFIDNKCIYDIQSSEISMTGGDRYSYKLLKEMGTKEGLKAFYKLKGIPVWMVGKRKFLQNMESNQQLTAKVENQLQGIMDEFALSLKKEIAANN